MFQFPSEGKITLTLLSSYSATELTRDLIGKGGASICPYNLGDSVASFRNLNTFIVSGRPGSERSIRMAQDFSKFLSLEA